MGGSRRVSLGAGCLALLMQFTIGGGSEIVDRFEGLVKTALFLIAAAECDRFDGIIGLQQALGCTVDAAADDVGMDGALYQYVKTGLQFFSVNGEFPADCLNGMLFIEIFIDVVLDLFDQLDIFAFHARRRFNASDH